MLSTGETRGVDSDAFRAIISHQWRHFGHAYAVEEATYYLFFFLAPVTYFANSLAGPSQPPPRLPTARFFPVSWYPARTRLRFAVRAC